ncbi:unnamed protein product [Polarella glacialis]|uniref:Glucosyltransferase 24 catalytic domain-containing protein n=1 Tax=Polarella glacialis TaxID=89957 RepID=A0A813KGE1_POLGL|nr:unnamed protein product [Polarella glacialis]
MGAGGASTEPAQTEEDSGKASLVPASTAELQTLHIFSVASGHLYEKLLGIMILSVRNQTKNPLHFWFIDNFLSPKFKAFVPLLAERYNFNFDFVTYKWPSWLNPQSEKQRLIWAYKVLFLDVLFPQDVPKVIFIDADQVVRADVRELWDLDLKGKPYAFVPMGDTNPETEGFRFWKQGYWKNHLGNMPYHISALYVVDLVEFRRTGIGESLRGVYNQLSRDPNSLSNLEQDKPVVAVVAVVAVVVVVVAVVVVAVAVVVVVVAVLAVVGVVVVVVVVAVAVVVVVVGVVVVGVVVVVVGVVGVVVVVGGDGGDSGVAVVVVVVVAVVVVAVIVVVAPTWSGQTLYLFVVVV